MTVDLIAACWTISGDSVASRNEISEVELETRAAAAAAVGYAGIGVVHADLEATVDRIGYQGVRRIIEDCGLRYLQLEMLIDFFAEGDRRAKSDRVRDDLLKAAGELGAFQVKVGGIFDGSRPPLGVVAEQFSALCDQFERHSCEVAFEPMPFANINSLDLGCELMRLAGHANGGLLLDVWHIARMGDDYSKIAAVPREFIRAVELDDADADAVGDMFEDTIDRRKLCGEGDLDVPAFIAAVKDAGWTGPYGVEIISTEHRALSVEDQAARSFATTMQQFDDPRVTGELR